MKANRIFQNRQNCYYGATGMRFHFLRSFFLYRAKCAKIETSVEADAPRLSWVINLSQARSVPVSLGEKGHLVRSWVICIHVWECYIQRS